MDDIQFLKDNSDTLNRLAGAARDKLSRELAQTGRHPLIGKPCLYRNFKGLAPAIPYRSFYMERNDHCDTGPRLVVVLWEPDEARNFWGRKAKPLTVAPADLIPVDPTSETGIDISHTLLEWLVNGWDEQKNHYDKKIAELEKEIASLKGELQVMDDARVNGPA